MLVVGGGIIGLEMATVYDALGTKVSVVELTDALMPGTDPDLVRPLQKRIAKRYAQILLGTKVAKIEPAADGLHVTFEGKTTGTQAFDCVLMSVGRSPNGKRIGAENAGVNVDARGFIPVDRQMRTNVPNILAVGDIVGQPMLAHKANHEGRVAAEVAAGHEGGLRRPRDSVRGLHRSRGGLGRRDRDRGEGEGHRLRQGHVPLGGERPLARASTGTRASPRFSSTRRPTG